MDYRTVDPNSGRLIETHPTATESEIEAALNSACAAFDRWRRETIEERARALLRVATILEAQAEDLAGLMALEMGKPVAQGRAEASKCAWGCRYYAENAASFLRPRQRDSDGAEAFVRYDPLGPLLAIMPWNFPFWQFFRFAAPALAAGNVVLLKHAPNTPRCGLRIEALMLEAGLPTGLVRNLFLSNDQAARTIGDSRVRGVTLTGSTRAGSQVAATAGRHLKPMVMELGGSDPFIVLEDADVERAAEIGVAARCLNSGQSCIAAKRFLVHEPVFDAFRTRFVAGMRAQVMGDPTDGTVTLGPLARADLRDRLAGQVEASTSRGAELICGGAPPGTPGFFYPPTVLLGAPANSPAAEEELFGPVAVLMPFTDEDEAWRIANSTVYGLGASLWTTDLPRARRIVPRIDAGSVFVNGLVKSDPRLPFGGVKQSGFGRELGREGILEFVNAKTVWIG